MMTEEQVKEKITQLRREFIDAVKKGDDSYAACIGIMMAAYLSVLEGE